MRIIVETQSRLRTRKLRRLRRAARRFVRRLAGVPIEPEARPVTFRRVSRMRSVVADVVPDPLLQSRQARSMAIGFLLGSIHVVFAFLSVVVGLLTRSVWTISVGLLIAALNAGKSYLASGALMGGALEGRAESIESLRRCRRAGIALMLVVVAMSGTVARLVVAGYGHPYPGLLIYLYAGYALVQIVVACVNLARARRETYLALRGVRAFNLACALISVFALQTVLLSRVAWRELPIRVSRGLVEGVVGGTVCLLIVCLGFWLTVTAGSKLDERLGKIRRRMLGGRRPRRARLRRAAR